MNASSGDVKAASTTKRTIARLAIGLVLVALLVIAYAFWKKSREMWLDASLQNLRAAVGRQQYKEGVALADEILATDPSLMEAAMLGAEAAVATKDLARCLKFLRQATERPHPKLAEAYLRMGMIYLQQWKAREAERALRRAVEVAPRDPPAVQHLAFLLSLEGRRFESLKYRFRLLTLGHFSLDDLALLGHHQVVLNAKQQLEQFLKVEPDDPMPRLGLGRLALRANELEAAESHFRAVLERYPELSDAWAWLGHALLKRPRESVESSMQTWKEQVPESASEHPETWVVRGLWAQRRRDWIGASRCFWEAVTRDPDHGVALYQLSVSLAAAGEGERAEPFRVRAAAVQELEQAASQLYEMSLSARRMARAAELCESLGRVWEAAAWCRELLGYQAPPGIEPGRQPTQEELDAFYDARRRCQTVLARVTPQVRREPPRVDPAFDPAKKTSLASIPIPAFDPVSPEELKSPAADLARQPAFVDVTRDMGIDFSYFNADDPSTEGRRMFEFTGGGVTVLDYDQDGWPDLYFTQGCAWPPDPEQSRYEDRLYRNVGGKRFVDVTEQSGLGDRGFTQGAAAGDFNNDGWPDLMVGNVGRNRLYLNNGDGTFTERSEPAGLRSDVWTTSCAIADLNGDAVPDIYCVNYLKKGRAFQLICGRDGKLRACSPTEFDAEQDRFFLGRGDGTFTDRTDAAGFVRPLGKGLGCLIADLDRSGKLEVFVANDTTANFFFVNERPLGDAPRFEDRALLVGLAHNRNGEAQACMGVGADDVDGDGKPDLFVTNFHGEWNTLYRQQPAESFLFLDESDLWGVTETSLDTLGFGCQFLDAELDGLPDLIITNGHVDDFSFRGDPYRMPPQYLRNVGNRFTDWPAEQLGPFFSKPLLGRGLARIDFDADGREEFAVSHLDTPAALLHNQTRDPGHYLAVRLVGRQSARDPIGADVTVESGDLKRSRQLTAGDGYLASNEHILIFGLGDRERVDRLTVRWPDGKIEQFRDLPAGQQIKIVQGLGLFSLRPGAPAP